MDLIEFVSKLSQIILVDLVLAGDNAIVIGLVAARFTSEYRRKVILYGVGAAIVLRIIFALLTVQLYAVKGLLLVGGGLLLWVCWRLWLDLRRPPEPRSAPTPDGADNAVAAAQNPSIMSAVGQVAVADASMSLDNVLAVAGIADGHYGILIFGLVLSVSLMVFGATIIAEYLQKYRWIGYLGLLAILYVALEMLYRGYLRFI